MSRTSYIKVTVTSFPITVHSTTLARLPFFLRNLFHHLSTQRLTVTNFESFQRVIQIICNSKTKHERFRDLIDHDIRANLPANDVLKGLICDDNFDDKDIDQVMEEFRSRHSTNNTGSSTAVASSSTATEPSILAGMGEGGAEQGQSRGRKAGRDAAGNMVNKRNGVGQRSKALDREAVARGKCRPLSPSQLDDDEISLRAAAVKRRRRAQAALQWQTIPLCRTSTRLTDSTFVRQNGLAFPRSIHGTPPSSSLSADFLTSFPQLVNVGSGVDLDSHLMKTWELGEKIFSLGNSTDLFLNRLQSQHMDHPLSRAMRKKVAENIYIDFNKFYGSFEHGYNTDDIGTTISGDLKVVSTDQQTRSQLLLPILIGIEFSMPGGLPSSFSIRIGKRSWKTTAPLSKTCYDRQVGLLSSRLRSIPTRTSDINTLHLPFIWTTWGI